MSAERVLRELLEACAVQHDKTQKVVEEADLLIMKARIVRARVKTNMRKRAAKRAAK